MNGHSGDQAEGLRRLLHGAQTRVLALISGKPRVGQTTVAINLAWTLAAQGKTVWIVDEGLGADSVVTRLGGRARYELAQLLQHQIDLTQVLISYSAGISILPAREGLRRSTRLDAEQCAQLTRNFSAVSPQPDFVILDLAADRSHVNFAAAAAADDIVVLLAPDHAAITAAYAVIKKLAHDYARAEFYLLLAKSKQGSDEKAVYNNMTLAARRYMHAQARGLSPIPWDESVKRGQRLGKPVAQAFPDADASVAYGLLAQTIMGWPSASVENRHLEGFLHRLIMSPRIVQTSASM